MQVGGTRRKLDLAGSQQSSGARGSGDAAVSPTRTPPPKRLSTRAAVPDASDVAPLDIAQLSRGFQTMHRQAEVDRKWMGDLALHVQELLSEQPKLLRRLPNNESRIGTLRREYG